MQSKPKRFHEETGMYIDWPQLKRLPQVNTFIDIGVGPKGTQFFGSNSVMQKLFASILSMNLNLLLRNFYKIQIIFS